MSYEKLHLRGDRVDTAAASNLELSLVMKNGQPKLAVDTQRIELSIHADRFLCLEGVLFLL